MRHRLLSGLVAAAACTLTVSSAFAGCCVQSYSCCQSSSYGYQQTYGSYGYPSYSSGLGYGAGLGYSAPGVYSYGYQSYRPSYWVNQGPAYTGPNVTDFAQPTYSDEGYAYPAGYTGAPSYRYGVSAYPYVRSNWTSSRWQRPYARPYATRQSYVNWRYQHQYRSASFAPRHMSSYQTPRFHAGYQRSAPRPHTITRRPYGY